MWTAVVTPANEVANLFGGNVGEDNIVENLAPRRQMRRWVSEVATPGTAVKRPCGVWGVELQIESDFDDRLVFGCQRGCGGL